MANKTLYVGNLPYDTSEDDLRELFGPYGPVAEIRLIGDKGFAFVDISAEMVPTAIDDLNGKDFNGRNLTVNEARPRTERRSSGGFGGGGRGGYGGGRGGSGGGRQGGGGGGGRSHRDW